jgi:hypothetical protein
MKNFLPLVASENGGDNAYTMLRQPPESQHPLPHALLEGMISHNPWDGIPFTRIKAHLMTAWTFRFYLRGRYSQSSINTIQRKLNQVTQDAAQLNVDHPSLPPDKRQHMDILLAKGP